MHEVLFEWAIPEKYVTHQVSLQTLLDRGFQDQYFRISASTSEVLYHIARRFQFCRHDPYQVGIALGTFAQKFGARAPLDWISHQLFHDCMDTETLSDDIVKLTSGLESCISTRRIVVYLTLALPRSLASISFVMWMMGLRLP